MTYIDLLNAFWNWRRFNVIPHSAADLYFCLLDFANATKWEDKITVPNSRITGMIDISEGNLFKARNSLVQNRLIKYTNGKKGQAGTYQINLTTLNFYSNKGSNEGSNEGSNTEVLRGVISEQSVQHNKEKEEEEDKNTPHTPLRPKNETKGKTKAEHKDGYGELKNVLLTPKEYETLIARYGELDVMRMIAKLGSYKQSSGKTYKSDYGAINTWVVNAVAEDKERTGKNIAVYNDNSVNHSELEELMRERDLQEFSGLDG